jgi:hypothetical protein
MDRRKGFSFFDDIEKGVILCFACGILIKFIFVFDFKYQGKEALLLIFRKQFPRGHVFVDKKRRT